MWYETAHILEEPTIVITYPNGGGWYSLQLQCPVNIDTYFLNIGCGNVKRTGSVQDPVAFFLIQLLNARFF
jgi:hypothetical protein